MVVDSVSDETCRSTDFALRDVDLRVRPNPTVMMSGIRQLFFFFFVLPTLLSATSVCTKHGEREENEETKSNPNQKLGYFTAAIAVERVALYPPFSSFANLVSNESNPSILSNI